jgi:hypothetical protein
MKLKYTEIKAYRLQQLAQQNNCCALCGEPVVDDAVLDHDHKTGLLRKVLHRGCNIMLGKIENAMPRCRVDMNKLEVIAGRLIEYIKTQHTDILHPKHKIKEPKMPGRGRGKGKKPPKR